MPSEALSSDVAACRTKSPHVATDPATSLATSAVRARAVRGPLELACRDAGLPPCAESLQRLEDVAMHAGIVPRGGTATPAALRRAARLYRKVMQDQKRVVPVAERAAPSKRQARKLLAGAHGLKSARQWKKWKKAQRRKQLGVH